jgi:hypothetical protein
VDAIHREGWKADGDVFSAILARRTVSNPLTAMRDHGLTGFHIHGAVAVLDP